MMLVHRIFCGWRWQQCQMNLPDLRVVKNCAQAVNVSEPSALRRALKFFVQVLENVRRSQFGANEENLMSPGPFAQAFSAAPN